MTAPAKILVVDDHPIIRRNLCALLAEQLHWAIYEANNGRVAVERSREIKPDVIVMDIVMPEMSGIEAAYEVRREAPGTKIILMSSHYTREEATLLARLFGDGNFIAKSDIGRELVPTLRRILPEESQAV